MFFRDRESSVPTMHTCEDASIDAMTSGENPGGVSTITKSLPARSST